MCVGLIWYCDTQWREVECVFKHNVVVISKNTGGIVQRCHFASKHFGLNCSCIFHVAFPISATTREYVEALVSTYTLFFIGLVTTSAQVGSISKTLICLAVYCLLTTFQGSILTKTVPHNWSIWESLHRQKICVTHLALIMPYVCMAWLTIDSSQNPPPLVTVATSDKPWCSDATHHVLTQFSRSEKYIVEQRGNWQHTDREDRAGYFRYETKSQLLNFVTFKHIQTINTILWLFDVSW